MTGPSASRGYFALGAEGLSKPMNFGNLLRTAHAFGASFFFTVDASWRLDDALPSDTSKAPEHLPYYGWKSLGDMRLPQGCALVGVELTPDAVDLPTFRHPARAAYVLGPERGSLSPQMIAACDFTVRIPTAFCINVATAGAIVLYDRVRSRGHLERPLRPGGRADRPSRSHGGPHYSGGRRLPG